MATTTSNMGLTKPDLTDPADVRVLNGNSDKLDGHRHLGGADGLPVRAVQAGLLASRPAAGTQGQVYVATDTNQIFFDNGSAWRSMDGEVEVVATSNTAPNGTTTQFNIGTGVAARKCDVYVNGLLREVNTDYTFSSGATYVNFLWTPQTGDKIQMKYVAA